MKRSPLRPKRPTPRRSAPERVAHNRTRPKAGAEPSGREKRHHARLRELGCLVCKAPPQIHHVTAPITGGRIARSHRRVTPLCFHHHKVEGGHHSVESLGHDGFWIVYRIDLLAEADRLWLESEEMGI